jgi:hypothetical protein
MSMWVETIHSNLSKEKSVTRKSDFAQARLRAVEREFSATSEQQLAVQREFDGEITTSSWSA